MGTDLRGYDNLYFRQLMAGSAAAASIVFPQMSERVDVTHMVGSNAFVVFATGSALTPYNSVGSRLMMISGNSLSFPIRTGSILFIGSAGSPIGASTATLRVMAYY